jgi:hypothetical protein
VTLMKKYQPKTDFYGLCDFHMTWDQEIGRC